MKTCKKCYKKLKLDSFYKDKNLKDGHENTCKVCRRKNRKHHIKECEYCGGTFKATRKETRFCSTECKPQHRKERIQVECHMCGEQKEITLSRYYDYNHFYCSDKCKSEGYSMLYSGKNSVHYNTVKIECFVCQNEVERWASQVNKYEISYCSKECQAIDYQTRFSGKNSPTYNPEKSDLDRTLNRNIEGYPEWRRKVYARDNFACQACGDSDGGNLIAHHILNYSEHPELRTELSNGITFCESCHENFHNTYGYRNNNKEQLDLFLIK